MCYCLRKRHNEYNHIDSIVENHHSNAERLDGEYNGASIRNTVGSLPSDISVNVNQPIAAPTSSGGNIVVNEPTRKSRLSEEFKDAQNSAEDKFKEIGRYNAVQRIVVDGKSENIGVLAKNVESKLKNVISK